MPGFRLGWNVLVGVPMMVPSFMYEGVHNLHHARTRYGTVEDPEYLPLALMKPWTLPLFLLVSLLAPIALLFRFARAGAAVGAVSAAAHGWSSSVIRRCRSIPPSAAARPKARSRRSGSGMETAASLWAIALIALVATGVVPLRCVRDLPRGRFGRRGAQPGPHARRASLGE